MVRLSNEDILFFKREGYLVKRKVLDPDLMAQARNRLWEGAPPFHGPLYPGDLGGSHQKGRGMRRYDEPQGRLPMELP